MERKLATIRRVDEVLPIANADAIESARFGGWNVVIKKGEMKAGDPAVFFEVDSFLPEDPRYEFLRKSCYKMNYDGKMGFRLKTVRLRGTLSQGLALPLSAFPELAGKEDGFDATDLLGIDKFERPVPACLGGKAKGMIPSYIRKTDAERIQNLKEFFELLKGVSFEASEKMDGSSMTVYFKDGYMGICSRNLDLKPSEDNAFWKAARRLNMDARFQSISSTLRESGMSSNLAFQGELCGPGIQKNPLALLNVDFYLFNIWNIDTQCYLTPKMRRGVLEAMNSAPIVWPEAPVEIKAVPVINGDLKVFDEFPTMEQLLAFANGKSMINPDRIREGIVFKSNAEHNGAVTMFKAISNNYLLKED